MERERFDFIAKMPDAPGALQKAAEVIKRHGGNITRIHYDREIDSNTVFFEINAEGEEYERILEELKRIGYLQTSLEPTKILKLNVYLPHRPGALLEFLNHTTGARANIAFLDFDDKGTHPDRLTVTLRLEEKEAVESFLEHAKSTYRLEVLEYDPSGGKLDDTVFYVRLAQELRGILGGAEDSFLMKLLHDSNHIAQELANLGKNPRDVFDSIIETGRRLKETAQRFYADVQTINLGSAALFCFQPPCGGNSYAIRSDRETVMVDTGYGIYHARLKEMLHYYGLDEPKRILVTHADADHVGAAGFFGAVAEMHPVSRKILEKNNRAYGTEIAENILEGVYTKLINLFSGSAVPEKIAEFGTTVKRMEGPFPVIDEVSICGLRFSVLEGLDGHLPGQVFLFCEEEKVLFTGDSLINFDSLSDDRKKFNLLAKNLMTSVNVDSGKAKMERDGLLAVAKQHKGCILCCGHGAVSRLDGERLVACGDGKRFSNSRMQCSEYK